MYLCSQALCTDNNYAVKELVFLYLSHMSGNVYIQVIILGDCVQWLSVMEYSATQYFYLNTTSKKDK
jgi:hypothetical protein